MSAAAGRTAGKVGQAVGRAASKANTAANEAAASGKGRNGALQKGAKRDPELYVDISSSHIEKWYSYTDLNGRSSSR